MTWIKAIHKQNWGLRARVVARLCQDICNQNLDCGPKPEEIDKLYNQCKSSKTPQNIVEAREIEGQLNSSKLVSSDIS